MQWVKVCRVHRKYLILDAFTELQILLFLLYNFMLKPDIYWESFPTAMILPTPAYLDEVQ